MSEPERSGGWALLRRGFALKAWLLVGLLCVVFALTATCGVVVAVLGASFAGCEPQAAAAPSTPSGPAPSASALQDIPPARLRLYQQAGARFDLDWTFLASIGTQECASGTCAGVNSAGCAGPMQIAYVRGSGCSPGNGPTLWERFAVNVHPGQPLSVNDLADAIYTAARILREDKGAPATGGSYEAYRQAACHYYGACADASANYADEVMARAVQYGFTGKGSPPPTTPSLAQPVDSQPSTGCAAGASSLGGTAQAGQIVRVAEHEIGQGEQPAGSNCTAYGPCEEWCSLWVAWVWQHAGISLPGSTALYGYSGSLYTWAEQHGGQVLPPTAKPSPGDAVFYGSGPSGSVHVGIVERVRSDGQIVTIEGNYGHRVSRVGPFVPSHPVGESGPIYGYARPPGPATKGAGT